MTNLYQKLGGEKKSALMSKDYSQVRGKQRVKMSAIYKFVEIGRSHALVLILLQWLLYHKCVSISVIEWFCLSSARCPELNTTRLSITEPSSNYGPIQESSTYSAGQGAQGQVTLQPNEIQCKAKPPSLLSQSALDHGKACVSDRFTGTLQITAQPQQLGWEKVSRLYMHLAIA